MADSYVEIDSILDDLDSVIESEGCDPVSCGDTLKDLCKQWQYQCTRVDREGIILSFVNMEMPNAPVDDRFNWWSWTLLGPINHVELTVCGSCTTFRVTTQLGSEFRAMKRFGPFYEHYGLMITREQCTNLTREIATRTGKPYDEWWLASLLCMFACECGDPESETCSKLVIESMRQASIIDEDESLRNLPSDLYDWLLSDKITRQYQVERLEPDAVGEEMV